MGPLSVGPLHIFLWVMEPNPDSRRKQLYLLSNRSPAQLPRVSDPRHIVVAQGTSDSQVEVEAMAIVLAVITLALMVLAMYAVTGLILFVQAWVLSGGRIGRDRHD